MQGKGKQFTANTQILRRSSQRLRRGSGTEGTGLRSGTAVSDPITTRWERGAPHSRPAALGPHDSPQPPRASPRPGHPRRRHRLPPLGGGVTPRDAAAPGAGAAPAPLSVAFAGSEAARDCPLPPPRLGSRVSSRRGWTEGLCASHARGHCPLRDPRAPGALGREPRLQKASNSGEKEGGVRRKEAASGMSSVCWMPFGWQL